jgi:hypothetical protein
LACTSDAGPQADPGGPELDCPEGVFRREPDDIVLRLDVGKLAGNLCIQGSQSVLRSGFVLLPGLFGRLFLGFERLGLFGRLVLASIEFGIARALAFGKIGLRLAWEACKALFLRFRPRVRRLDGRLLSRFGAFLFTAGRFRCGVSPLKGRFWCLRCCELPVRGALRGWFLFGCYLLLAPRADCVGASMALIDPVSAGSEGAGVLPAGAAVVSSAI